MFEKYSEIYVADLATIKDHDILFEYTEPVIKESLERLRDTLIPIVPKYLKIDIICGFNDTDVKYDLGLRLSSCQRTYEIEDVLSSLKQKLKVAEFVDSTDGLAIKVNDVKYTLYKHHQDDLGDNFMFT